MGSHTRAFQLAINKGRALSLTPLNGGSKSPLGRFSKKYRFKMENVCYKLRLCINFQQEGCRGVNLLFSGTNSAWGNRSLYAKFGWQVTYPLSNTHILHTFGLIHSGWTVADSKKGSIITNRKSHACFPMSHQRRSCVDPNSPKWGIEIPNLAFSPTR